MYLKRRGGSIASCLTTSVDTDVFSLRAAAVTALQHEAAPHLTELQVEGSGSQDPLDSTATIQELLHEGILRDRSVLVLDDQVKSLSLFVKTRDGNRVPIRVPESQFVCSLKQSASSALRLGLTSEQITLRVEGGSRSEPIDSTASVHDLVTAGVLKERSVLIAETNRVEVPIILKHGRGLHPPVRVVVFADMTIAALKALAVKRVQVDRTLDLVSLRHDLDHWHSRLDDMATLKKLLEAGAIDSECTLVVSENMRLPEGASQLTFDENLDGDEGEEDLMVAVGSSPHHPTHPIVLTKQQFGKVREFVEDSFRSTATPSMLLPVGVAGSGKTTMLTHVLPAIVQADYEEKLRTNPNEARTPVYLHVCLSHCTSIQLATETIVREATALMKSLRLSIPIEQTGGEEPQPPALVSALVPLAQAIKDHRGVLVLTIDHVQAPILHESLKASIAFAQELHQVLHGLHSIGMMGVTGSSLLSFLYVYSRAVPPKVDPRTFLAMVECGENPATTKLMNDILQSYETSATLAPSAFGTSTTAAAEGTVWKQVSPAAVAHVASQMDLFDGHLEDTLKSVAKDITNETTADMSYAVLVMNRHERVQLHRRIPANPVEATWMTAVTAFSGQPRPVFPTVSKRILRPDGWLASAPVSVMRALPDDVVSNLNVVWSQRSRTRVAGEVSNTVTAIFEANIKDFQGLDRVGRGFRGLMDELHKASASNRGVDMGTSPITMSSRGRERRVVSRQLGLFLLHWTHTYHRHISTDLSRLQDPSLHPGVIALAVEAAVRRFFGPGEVL